MAAPKPNATWNPFLVNEKDNTGEIILANWIFFTFGENKSFNRDLYLYLYVRFVRTVHTVPKVPENPEP